MKAVLALVTLIGSTLASSCSSTALSCSSSANSDTCCSPEYGLVVLNLQWVPGYGPDNAFTLHGLWPDKCSGAYAPSGGCDSSRASSSIASVIKSKDSSLYSSMLTYWPSDQGDNNVFWSHEWSKHGTCVSTYDPDCYDNYEDGEDIVDYFQKAMDLRSQYNVYNAFSSNGITPGGTYTATEMQSAIENYFGAKAKIDCSSGTLSDVALYFYVRGRDTYVITDALSTGSCSGDVEYPTK
ncbi:hypothetical protein G6F60_010024 [Rhizopus arrhizus]|nr:hypothetical protein G6F23_012078 [Rhizopus arrhizus]KAG0758185.1 hypothetical protein G6F24_009975 [Rhizopus arrhizus]KAG0936933.1 hypothetical protein G6F32_009942 [Rhizopus arrhizus]KAG1374079.1 hypothetical protein G6F61_009636 [Rhizopus arrhizus]KAG1395794.1 hypothetical protein G6F60_010024 [Rhizopus arrhizus]